MSDENTYDNSSDIYTTVKSNYLNKSPVLYLRRRRNTDYVRHQPSSNLNDASRANMPRYPHVMKHFGTTKEEDPRQPVDNGDIYPNHFASARIGSAEWVRFKDYKKKLPIWIRSVQLVIDGKCSSPTA